jgi:hypothetical protein
MEISTGPTALVSPKLTRSSTILQSLVIVLVAGFFCLPFLIHGLPLTGDSTLHATYQYHFSRQFWSGDTYPRWLTNANKGYGSPIFLIQYPLPYWITALLRPLTRFAPTPNREAHELGVFSFLALVVAGLSARLWLQKRCAPFAATAGAIVYISLPYLLAFNLYNDIAIGQLAVYATMPLALAACESLRLRFTAISALGIVWALLVLSNLLTALVFLPLMVGYVVACAESRGMSLAKSTVAILLSLAMGTCLAAVYLIPFIVYLKLFNINGLLTLPGYELSHHFAYVRLASLSKPLVLTTLLGALIVALIAARSCWRAGGSLAFRAWVLLTLGFGVLMITPGLGLWLVGLSGLKPPVFKVIDYFPERLLIMALLTLALGVYAYTHVSENSAGRRDYTLLVLLVTACGAFMLMLPWSAFFWKAIPDLARAVQFPHRLGVVLTIATAGLFAAAIDSCLRHKANHMGSGPAIVVTLMAIAVVAGGILAWRVDWRWAQVLRNPPMVHLELTRDVDHTYRTYVSPDHLAGFANLIGAERNNDQVQSAYVKPGAADLVRGQGVVNVIRQSPRKLLVSYAVSGDALARIGLLYSPLWRIKSTSESSGGPIPESSAEGLVEIPLVPGRHDLQLVFDVGWPERCGVIVTCVSIIVVAIGLLVSSVLFRA